ncbi:MAG: UDP-N-acetylmuramate--L-alanine ligase [Planctomycetota bacterium]
MSTEPRPLMSAHLVGVCGAGMKALAELLEEFGWHLSGSDLAPATAAIESLARRGLRFHQGHSAAHVPLDVECLVYSPAIGAENPERIEAARRGVPQWSYSQMVGRLMQTRTGVCIAGTHGKSTTTAMVGWVLTHAGRDPSVLVGAELGDGLLGEEEPLTLTLSPQSRGEGTRNVERLAMLSQAHRSGWAGAGELFVVESCEFQRSFLDFHPRYAAILNVEPDHFDCFADLPAVVQAFDEFAQQVSPDGVLVVRGDCHAALDSVRRARAKVVTFGAASHCEWQADEIRHAPEGVQFRVVCRGQARGAVELNLHGNHNVLNGLAAVAVCTEIGLSTEEAIAGLRSFPGIRRRFEVVGEWNGITLINDYAHHPTAVRATLKTARDVYRSRRIWCAFQPHQVSRTLALMDEFSESFDESDEVLIAPVFAAREQVTDEPVLASRELVRRIALRGVSVRFVESLDRIVTTVEDAARPGDLLIAMGAGDIEWIPHELSRRIC